MNRNLVLNLIFIGLFILFLTLSLMVDFFFFIPILCFLPFSYRTNTRKKINFEQRVPENSSKQNFKRIKVKYCPKCGGEIKQSIAKFCYHCGEKLNNIQDEVSYG